MNRIKEPTTGGWKNLSADEAARSLELAKDRAVRAGLPEKARERIEELMKGGGKLHPPRYGGPPVVITHGGRSHHFIPKEDERDQAADKLAKATQDMAKKNGHPAIILPKQGYHHVIVSNTKVSHKGVNEAKNKYSEGDPKVPYILTPTGWRSLSENDEKGDQGRYPPRMTPKRAEEIEKLWAEAKAKARKKLQAHLNRRGLNESQMELLEALCDAGYLSDEQLVEGVRSFLAGKLEDSAEKHSNVARLAGEREEFVGKALKAGRGGALFGRKGTDRHAEAEVRRQGKKKNRALSAAEQRSALARLIKPSQR